MSDGGRSIWRKLGDALQGTELRLWHMVVAAVFTTLVTTVVPLWIDHKDRQSELIHERSRELVDVSSDFENNVNRLVNSGEPFGSPAELASLTLNVEQQIRALNKIRPQLSDAEQKALADSYALLLVSVRNMLQNGLSVSETRDFGIAAQKLVNTRDELLAKLS